MVTVIITVTVKLPVYNFADKPIDVGVYRSYTIASSDYRYRHALTRAERDSFNKRARIGTVHFICELGLVKAVGSYDIVDYCKRADRD